MANQPAGGPSASRPVEVLKITAGHTARVRFLANYTGGILHWNGRRYDPCPGEGDCPAAQHRQFPVWHAWAPGEVLEPGTGLWWPMVIEVTGKLDEALTGRCLRGEVWDLTRQPSKKRGKPVLAQFLRNYPSSSLRQPFEVLPVLLRLYHVPAIALGLPNPMPRQQILGPSTADAEQTIEVPTEQPVTGPTEEQRAAIRQLAGRVGNMPPVGPEPSANGKGPKHGK